MKVINMQFKEHEFLCRKGEPTKNSAYDTSLFKLCDKAGIRRFSMHVLRHTMATRCIEGGMRPKTLQVILGHANVGITMNLYVDVTEEEKFKEVKDFIREMGLPATLGELGVDESTDLKAIADSCVIVSGGYRRLTHGEIFEIFRECL